LPENYITATTERFFGMGALAAVVNKEDGDAVDTAISMLKALKHRSTGTYGIASATRVNIEKSVELLKKQNLNSPVVIGYAFSKTLPKDKTQPIELDAATLVFDGRVHLANPQLSDVEFAAEKLKQNHQKAAKTLIEESEGDFAFAVAEQNKLIAGRDPLGVCPLYYGENNAVLALASERKALWKIGIRETGSFPPGELAIVDRQGFKFKPVRKIVKCKVKRISVGDATMRLQTLLQRSIRMRASGLKDVAVAFSGGLDSSLIGLLAKQTGANVHLVFVSLADQPEIEYARKAADALKLQVHVKLYDERDVERIFPKVLWLIEEADAVKASIGIPFCWAAENAAKMGLKAMLAGQGADELFGGYMRYLTAYSRRGKGRASEIIFRDVLKMHEANFERDSKICGYHNVELKLPFATYQMAQFAVNLPLELKIEPRCDTNRKIVLRQVAKNVGLPEFIVNKPKKAIQYATGVTKTLKKLAKRKGLSIREYSKEVFQNTFLNGD
jgi:asparagine synthase (glutamine-hydrolysing)